MKYFKKWREFQEQSHRQILYEKVLNEISIDNYEKIKDWLADQGDEALPFNNLFDGKMRLVIPLGAAISPESDIGRLFKYLERNKWTPDLKTGLATREAKPPDPNVPSEPNLGVIVYKSLDNNPAAGVVHVICGFAIIFLS